MKKISIGFILTFVLFVSTSLNMYATCPSGYTSYTLSATYPYTYVVSGVTYYYTCPMTIKYCCKWDNTLKQVVIIIDDFYGTTTNCPDAIPDWSDFINWLHNQVALASHVSCAPAFPPCDDVNNPYYETKITSSQCWKIENILVDGAYNDFDGYINTSTVKLQINV